MGFVPNQKTRKCTNTAPQAVRFQHATAHANYEVLCFDIKCKNIHSMMQALEWAATQDLCNIRSFYLRQKALSFYTFQVVNLARPKQISWAHAHPSGQILCKVWDQQSAVWKTSPISHNLKSFKRARHDWILIIPIGQAPALLTTLRWLAAYVQCWRQHYSLCWS